MNTDTRNSSFELLRIICIFGIITMHTYGVFYSTATGSNLIYGNYLNNSLYKPAVLEDTHQNRKLIFH